MSLESWLDYAEHNLPVYNHTPSEFAPSRTRENFEVLAHFHTPFAEMDLRDDVRRIETPTLVLAGRDDPITPFECSSEILDLLPERAGPARDRRRRRARDLP